MRRNVANEDPYPDTTRLYIYIFNVSLVSSYLDLEINLIPYFWVLWLSVDLILVRSKNTHCSALLKASQLWSM